MKSETLPYGWTTSMLGEIGRYLNGRGFKKSEWSSTGRPIIRIQDLTGTGGDPNYFAGEVDVRHEVEAGDLLISWAATLGAYIWHGPPAVLNQHIFKVESYIEKRFHYWAVQHVLDDLQRETHGSGMVHVTKGRFEATKIPVPPLPEQQRIVSAIESYVSRLDDAAAGLERVQRNLKRYRASVLQAAVEGRLVPTEAELARAEGRDYEPAFVLLERILAERRRRWEATRKKRYAEPDIPRTTQLPPLPAGWCWATVDQLTDGARMCAYGVLVPGPDVFDGVPLVRVGDVADGRVDLSHLKRINKRIADRFARTYLQGGEVLITLVGTIGRTAVAPKTLEGANVARAIGVIPTTALVSPRWVEVWFRSPLQRATLGGKAHEVARKTLNLEDVRSAPVALPPLSEQLRIVEQLEDLDSITDSIDATVGSARSRSERMRQSILQSAFEGKLVDQDPVDEPAALLLERIRETRESAEEARPPRGRRRTRA